ncbi:hypothetical protein GYA13_02340 [Candidatus Kuenenbacteria bacterium]|nr:hypothetical protein [Candidatus Kuenenbacteria bacterium]
MKESAQAEWFEKFEVKTTADWKALLLTEPAKAKEALQYVIDNRDHFLQYNDGWVRDRHKELGKAKLKAEFGIADTGEFQQALKEGKIEGAKKWLEGVIRCHEQNDPIVGHYGATWDNWLRDREEELEQVENK